MPRAPRIEYENALYHIMARGDRRELIVFDDRDRKTFLRTLEQVCERTGWHVFAWVLMDNHYHLAIRTPRANLVEGMTWFQNTFTRRINVRHRLWGHLFGGRYKSIIVEDETLGGGGSGRLDYLATLVDYIHLNPARAGLADGGDRGVAEFPWSALAQGYVSSPAKRPTWLRVAEGLAMSGLPDTVSGRRRYVARLDLQVRKEKRERIGLVGLESQSLQSTLKRGWYWGSEAFKEQLLDRFGPEAKKRKNRDDRSSPMLKDHGVMDAERIIAEACRHYGMDENELLAKRRGDLRRTSVAWKIWKHAIVPQRWMAGRLRMNSAANVSQALRRFEVVDEKRFPKEIRKWRLLKIDDRPDW